MAPKKKAEKMSLGEFLGDQAGGSWADEMEDMPLPSSDSRAGYGNGRSYDRPSFGGGMRDNVNERGFSIREELPLPSRPPFTAHLANLSFDVTQADVEDFFTGCSVTNVRIVEDKLDRKPKGFGYVEFETLEGLKKALELSGSQFQGRNVRVSVADPPKDRGEAREITDWSRKGPLPDLPNTRRPSDRGFGRNFDNASDAGSDRGSRRPPSFEPAGDGRSRDLGNWERRGPLSPVPGAAPMRDGGSVRAGGERPPFERRQSPAWGEGHSQDGSRPPRREFQERPVVDRAPTAAEQDNQWRARMKQDVPTPTITTPDASMPSSPATAAPPTPAARPKLNLTKRTVSEATNPEASTPTTESKASPFGAARPIDTAQREKDIEERRVAQRVKKEQEDKEREDKIRAEKAEKAEKDARSLPPPSAPTGPKAEAVADSNTSAKANGAKSKEEGEGEPQQRPTFEILRRMTDQGEENGSAANAEDGAPDASANGAIVDDKSVKPREIVRNAGEADESSSTADALEDDGWTSVGGTKDKRRRGGARALAS